MFTYTYSTKNHPFHDLLDNVSNGNYPPYNLIRYGEEEQRLEIAVAGFTKDDIKVQTKKGLLIVTGEKSEDDDREYIEKGISSRKFIRKWKLSKNAKVKSVKMKNGLLSIDIHVEIPESEKTKDFEIGYTDTEFLQD